ncbi:rhomboid family intramembrane serine protease [Microbulbifer flavimaris]|uniref:Rhomboid family intramembrane serine protease n=1 Tax=Microbulbifer flavimaris TaxID=1781068 RepID=A0ABX4HZ86_9GAMM|nr:MULTISPECIES: rhomboid family intramembrane serine protease [Microbulbifer]KUJ82800.1 rhomboid family intramembrane serine protease [Microbulbifer sp. ZGT114]PCO04975.1 rhomboid family intramembrane serine protease [Microbulbifer flavimaris]
MLIIPIQNKPDWRRPPLMCFALIALNLLVFIFYQGRDEARWQAAEEYYFSSDLPVLEEQRFLVYINEEHPEWRMHMDAQGEEFVYRELLGNREFHQWLLPQLRAEGETEWLAQRQQFDQLRNRLSAFALGLTPAEPTLAGLFGHMFLHGSWDHLIGNMVFLLLFGLSVELALGGAWFAGLYLLGGLAAAGLHMVVEAGSPMPMVGASGAVSAVMGMFVAVYGVQRLRFFYTIGFMFGEFSAPALLVLPLWLAKELFGYFWGDAGIAYWAHLGGLLAGFVATMALLSRRPVLAQMPVEQGVPTAEQRVLARIDRLQEQGKYLEAGEAAGAAVRQHPQSIELIERAIELSSVAPDSEAYHRAHLALFALADDQAIGVGQLADSYRRYLRATSRPRALSAKACLLLARRAAREKQWGWLEELLRRLQGQGVDHPLLPRLGTALVDHYRRLGEEVRAREIQQLVRPASVSD